MLGGLAAAVVVAGIDRTAQLQGIVIAAAVALVTGLAAGGLVSLAGRRTEPYVDEAEFLVDVEEGAIGAGELAPEFAAEPTRSE